jgi:GT2 family glycosyltransferase
MIKQRMNGYKNNITVSVIICTKNREESLSNCLESINIQSRIPDEIVIIDDGNLKFNKLSVAYSSLINKFIYIKKNEPGLTASRNLGSVTANGDIIMFIDDDVILDRGYIEAIMNTFNNDPEEIIAGVTGVLDIHYSWLVLAFLRFFGLDANKPGKILPSGIGILMRKGEVSSQIKVEWLSGCNMSFRKDVFSFMQFNEKYKSYGWGEDKDFTYRLSKTRTLVANPKAILIHKKEQAGRIDEYNFGFMEIMNLHQFFIDYMQKNLINWLIHIWAIIGIILKNVILIVIKKNRHDMMQRIFGNISALKLFISKNSANYKKLILL